jgi:hypothetical protein
VTVQNNGGNLRTAWRPILYTQHLIGDGNPAAAGFPEGAFITCRGTGGSAYNLIANASKK